MRTRSVDGNNMCLIAATKKFHTTIRTIKKLINEGKIKVISRNASKCIIDTTTLKEKYESKIPKAQVVQQIPEIPKNFSVMLNNNQMFSPCTGCEIQEYECGSVETCQKLNTWITGV